MTHHVLKVAYNTAVCVAEIT